ncbi:unnamed protein product [Ectocarpus sp. CCAP 1310/34]|nr:unnamed protein product [Ectocarpus sp. CCAP 1310/34]
MGGGVPPRHTPIVPERGTTPSAGQTEASITSSCTNPLQVFKIQGVLRRVDRTRAKNVNPAKLLC